MAVQITILGLGQIGTSIGLALAEHKELVRRTGNDVDANLAKRAEKLGAVDHIVYNLPSSVRQADLVILALPVDEIYEVLKVIAPDIKEGAVVIDTSTAKTSVAQWAADLLPPDRHFVAWTPVTNPAYLLETSVGIDAAHADLFRDSLIFITTPPGTAAPAIKLASDLTTLVGGKPFYADQAEVDGLLAANTVLPELTAAALIASVVSQPGWKEGRKLAGTPFALATSPLMYLASNSETVGKAALANRENVLRMMDNLLAELGSLRQAIESEDGKKLHAQIKGAIEDRESWVSQRKVNDWIGVDAPPSLMPTPGDVLGRLIGLRPKSQTKTKKPS